MENNKKMNINSNLRKRTSLIKYELNKNGLILKVAQKTSFK